MPSRLKSLELQGYKTFAIRTVFEFAGTITAIVGPNGSGKSNIADSIRWVLGEQSYSLLRGKKTEDMIFSGSQSRSRAGMASATMIFENNDGWLPIDFSEVSVTRRAYRDGTNEYLINGQRVRLRDVNELLSQSGLAERTYTIIGQGVVDAALALRPEDRRRLFEEAAGIGLYRSRREEAIRRLETTRRNLDRVQDILAELRPRLRSLERQARRAREFEQVRADLEILLREWYGYHWHRAQKDLNAARVEANRQEKILEQARRAQEVLEVELTQTRTNIQGLRARLTSWHRQLAQLHARREDLTRKRAVADERTRSLTEQEAILNTELASDEEELAVQEERLNAAIQDEAHLQLELLDAHNQLQAARQATEALQRDREGAEIELDSARKFFAELKDRQNQLQARHIERQAQIDRLRVAIKNTAEAVRRIEKEITAHQRGVAEAEDVLLQAEENLRSVLKDLDEHQFRLATIRDERQQNQEAHATHSAEIARLQAELQVLDQAESTFSGYAVGTQVLLKAAQRALLKGTQGAISNYLQVPAEFERAISAALGEYLDAVLLERSAETESALDILSKQAARGALLPLDALAPSPPLELSPVDVENLGEGLIGLGADLVVAPAGLRPAIDLLLGSTLVVRGRRDAQRVLSYLNRSALRYLRAVTLDGEIFHASGAVLTSGASDGAKGGTTTLSRPRRRNELTQMLAHAQERANNEEKRLAEIDRTLNDSKEQSHKLDKQLKAAQQQERAARDAYSHKKNDLEQAQRQAIWQAEQYTRMETDVSQGEKEADHIVHQLYELSEQIAQAEEAVRQKTLALADFSLDDLHAQESHWRTQSALADQSIQAAGAQRLERQEAVEVAKQAVQNTRDRLQVIVETVRSLEAEKIAQRQSETGVFNEIEALNQQINPAETELAAAEKLQDEALAKEARARQAFSRAEHNHAQARIGLARRQEALETWRRRIEDDFGLVAFDYADDISGPTPLPLDGMVEQLPRVTRLNPEVEEGVRRQRALLRRIGPVNPEAQDEYKQVKERYEFMTAQITDLEKAEDDVRQVIVELDALMQAELRKTFDAVATEFSEIFTRLFGGGSARLVLTDPDDMTNTGIDIEARLPGRRTQGLSLLSGGERSLTATSLVFALLRVSPTPFCVLDEVDAMLDETNVGRFRELLREISQNTQVVIVTHNRNTVQVADIIYGVTMGRDTASQVISLKLDEVSQVVN